MNIDLSPFCIVGKRKNRDLAIHEDYLLADGNGAAFNLDKKCIRIFPADLFQHLSSFVLIGVDTDDVFVEFSDGEAFGSVTQKIRIVLFHHLGADKNLSAEAEACGDLAGITLGIIS